ncbi:MAG TPA: histone deacetylase [bacterium]|nr:histone deacetylase [bacterium]
MPVAFLTHPDCLQHDPGPGHPERPARLRAVLDALQREEALEEHLRRLTPEPLDERLLEAVHSGGYVAQVRRLAQGGGGMLDPDTVLGPASYRAALAAAGAAVAAVDAVLAEGGVPDAFAALRPPGHHARPAQGMGFCLFNNVALAATHARERYRLARILILDWDVHHGNGTQEIFYRDDRVLFVSLHQEAWYPGTGEMTETGEGAGSGFTVNIPLPAGAGDAAYAHVFEEVVLPLLASFRPELVLISAGYDAHRDDPLGGMRLTSGGFRHLAAMVRGVHSGPIAAVLEGGYALRALGKSVLATLGALAGVATPGGEEPPGEEGVPYAAIRARVRDVRRIVRDTWRI